MEEIILTGSRRYGDRERIFSALQHRVTFSGPFVLKHGGCASGADALAHEWYEREGKQLGCIERVFKADWDAHGLAAGPIRNKEMVDDGADVALAFFEAGAENRGTQGTVDLAHVAGIPVIAYGPWGTSIS